MSSLKLLISTPAQPIQRGQGFYQIEEQTLFVQIGAFLNSHRFYSFIDSPVSRFDLDRKGHLLFFEINCPKNRWIVDDKLILPDIVEPADIRWLDFRKFIESPVITANRNKSVVKLRFSDKPICFNYYLADNVILQVSEAKCVAAIIVTEIVEDFAGRCISAFRRQLSGKDKVSSLSSDSISPSATLS